MTAPDKFFRHKIMTMFDPPTGTDELRREILDDTLSAFLEMRPVDDENEPVWRELLRTHRGRRWPLACDLTRALTAVREHKREVAPSVSQFPTNKPRDSDDPPLTSEEKIKGAAFMSMLLDYQKRGNIEALSGLSGSALANKALSEGYAEKVNARNARDGDDIRRRRVSMAA